MPIPAKGARLGGSPAHQRHILANLAVALFEHGKITTTAARARRLRPFAEHLITFAKRGDLHARRQVMAVVPDKRVVHDLFAEIGPSFIGREGGYTRITKVAPRKGDNAPLAVIELVRDETPARRRRARRSRGTAERATTARLGAEVAAGAEDETAAQVGEAYSADLDEIVPAGPVEASEGDDVAAEHAGADVTAAAQAAATAGATAAEDGAADDGGDAGETDDGWDAGDTDDSWDAGETDDSWSGGETDDATGSDEHE